MPFCYISVWTAELVLFVCNYGTVRVKHRFWNIALTLKAVGKLVVSKKHTTHGEIKDKKLSLILSNFVLMLILCIYGFTLLQITFAALFYDPNYLQYNRKYPKCITTCYSPDTGYQTITTYGNRPVYRDSSLNLRGLDLARRYYDKYRSDSRCKYRVRM